MPDLDHDVTEIREQINAATRARARSEQAYDAAKAQEQAALKQLRDTFGVSTAEQARAKHAELRQALADAAAELRTALAQTSA